MSKLQLLSMFRTQLNQVQVEIRKCGEEEKLSDLLEREYALRKFIEQEEKALIS